MMNPEKRFRLWMSTCLATAVAAFAYFLIADIHMPISADARLIYRVTQVSPEVNGRVVRVAVANNQRVQRGDLLFEIDPLVYRNAVQNAELQLEQAVQSNAELDAAIASAASQVNRAQAQYQDAIDRLVSCMADAGYALQLTTYPSGVIEVQPPVAVPDGDALMSSKHFCEKTTSIYAIMGYELQQGNPQLYADPTVVAFNCLQEAELLISTATVDDVKRFMYSSERDDLPFDPEDFGVKACFYGAGMAYGTVAEAE